MQRLVNYSCWYLHLDGHYSNKNSTSSSSILQKMFFAMQRGRRLTVRDARMTGNGTISVLLSSKKLPDVWIGIPCSQPYRSAVARRASPETQRPILPFLAITRRAAGLTRFRTASPASILVQNRQHHHGSLQSVRALLSEQLGCLF